MKKHWSTIAGMPVLAGEDYCGSLRATFVHPETGQILAFLVGWSRVVAPKDVLQWTAEHVQVGEEQDLVSPEDILRIREFGLRRTLLNGKKVLTRSGKSIGIVKDFSFETATDHLLGIETCKRLLFWEWAPRSFPIKDVQEITERAVILNVDLDQKEKVTEKATLSVAV